MKLSSLVGICACLAACRPDQLKTDTERGPQAAPKTVDRVPGGIFASDYIYYAGAYPDYGALGTRLREYCAAYRAAHPENPRSADFVWGVTGRHSCRPKADGSHLRVDESTLNAMYEELASMVDDRSNCFGRVFLGSQKVMHCDVAEPFNQPDPACPASSVEHPKGSGRYTDCGCEGTSKYRNWINYPAWREEVVNCQNYRLQGASAWLQTKPGARLPGDIRLGWYLTEEYPIALLQDPARLASARAMFGAAAEKTCAVALPSGHTQVDLAWSPGFGSKDFGATAPSARNQIVDHFASVAKEVAVRGRAGRCSDVAIWLQDDLGKAQKYESLAEARPGGYLAAHPRSHARSFTVKDDAIPWYQLFQQRLALLSEPISLAINMEMFALAEQTTPGLFSTRGAPSLRGEHQARLAAYERAGVPVGASWELVFWWLARQPRDATTIASRYAPLDGGGRPLKLAFVDTTLASPALRGAEHLWLGGINPQFEQRSPLVFEPATPIVRYKAAAWFLRDTYGPYPVLQNSGWCQDCNSTQAPWAETFSRVERYLAACDMQGNFCPNAPLRRSKAAVALVRHCRRSYRSVQPPPCAYDDGFSDVRNDTEHCNFIAQLKPLGIADRDETTFRPDDVISRGELLTYLSNIAARRSTTCHPDK